ncbi:HlyC/CorC family transporter [Streptosporangiaceae bacterium NEAU-GS5]|nr:HlyC/CorC family transporter [Streptosporangiaceae bacterium NEAU-GS5]
MSLLDLAIVVVLLAVNGFFVGAEFALISARRTQIEPGAAAGSRRARAVLAAMDAVPTMLAAAQLGVTLASLALGAVAEPVLGHALETLFADVGLPTELADPVGLALALLVVVTAHVIIGEMVPKNLALSGPDTAALWLVPPLLFVARVTRPLLAAIQATATLVLRGLGIPPTSEVRSVYTSDELPALIEESRRHRLLDQRERDRMLATLALHARPVRSVLVPIDQVVSVPAATDATRLQQYTARHGHSRFPVHGDDPQELRGYLHALDALNRHDPKKNGSREPLPVRPLLRIGETASLAEVLATLRGSRAQLAVVVDADGQALGIVTLRDVLAGLLPERGREVSG